MILEPINVLASWGGFFWTLGAIVLFFIGLVLIAVILIQDAKDGGGLGGAFGSGSGGELLGARGQKEITRLTAYAGVIFGVIVLLLGLFDPDRSPREFEGDRKTPETSLESTETDTPSDESQKKASPDAAKGGASSEKGGTEKGATEKDGTGEANASSTSGGTANTAPVLPPPKPATKGAENNGATEDATKKDQ